MATKQIALRRLKLFRIQKQLSDTREPKGFRAKAVQKMAALQDKHGRQAKLERQAIVFDYEDGTSEEISTVTCVVPGIEIETTDGPDVLERIQSTLEAMRPVDPEPPPPADAEHPLIARLKALPSAALDALRASLGL